MKILSGIVFFIFWSLPICFSQAISNDTVRLTKLSHGGILLDKGWKFHAGDDSAWSKPEFNDQDWQPINPALDIRHIPQLQNESIGWFRLKLLVDSTLMDQPLGMSLSQVGASEIYLDGSLLYKFGTVSAENDKEHTHYLLNRPFSIKLGAKRIQTIAVRYSYSPKGFLIKWTYENFCIRILLNTVGVTFSTFQKNARLSMVYEMSQASLWLLLSLIIITLYFSIRSQKAYLLIGTYSFLMFCSGVLRGLIARELTTTNFYTYTLFLSLLLALLSGLFALNAIFRLFNQNKNWYYYVLILGSIFAISSFFVFYDQATNIYLIIGILFGLEFMRRGWIAIHHNHPGAIVLFLSTLLFLILIAFVILFINFNNIRAAEFCGFLSIVNIPIGWCIFVAGEYGRTGIALQARVKDIEQLSLKAIAQEQEKQQLLASQNETLEKRVEERTSQLNESLRNLQSTQAQLIQSEKMASLGEITAGIAHEIQNPLNFVNNFSEINSELIADMKDEIYKGNMEEIKSIANHIDENEQKIIFHGKRADAIVKGMLQHSRASTDQKELANINAIADECLRLSYHNFRAKDKSFNATLQTELDESIGMVPLIPQDIVRVFVNLFNNAFYTVNEKSKQQIEDYEPTISVSSRMVNSKVEIRVKDNGNGIPKKVIDKIFQPFFTTKPTGQGTGLGLSLSYDIVKAHGGEINVNTSEGEFTEFVIQLPISV